jgi:transcriptional regulator with XRE-family HTH domain
MNPGRRIARNIQRMREERGLTQAQLAGMAGIAREQVSRIESRYHDPTPATLLKLAKALKINVVDLSKK